MSPVSNGPSQSAATGSIGHRVTTKLRWNDPSTLACVQLDVIAIGPHSPATRRAVAASDRRRRDVPACVTGLDRMRIASLNEGTSSGSPGAMPADSSREQSVLVSSSKAVIAESTWLRPRRARTRRSSTVRVSSTSCEMVNGSWLSSSSS